MCPMIRFATLQAPAFWLGRRQELDLVLSQGCAVVRKTLFPVAHQLNRTLKRRLR